MLLKKGQLPVLITIIVMMLSFSIYYIIIKNLEFLIYVGVIIIFFALILFTNQKVNYSTGVLWGLTLWAFLHMSGGSFRVNGARLYELMLIPITEHIFRYDQFVHIVGFFIATLVMYQVIKPLLKESDRWAALSIVVCMAGLGTGALNEIVEFAATLLAPSTGVGGYINTSLDLVADLIGAIAAVAWIRFKNK